MRLWAELELSRVSRKILVDKKLFIYTVGGIVDTLTEDLENWVGTIYLVEKIIDLSNLSKVAIEMLA